MTQNEEYKKLAEEIVEIVNQTTNDYDAREKIENILKNSVLSIWIKFKLDEWGKRKKDSIS